MGLHFNPLGQNPAVTNVGMRLFWERERKKEKREGGRREGRELAGTQAAALLPGARVGLRSFLAVQFSFASAAFDMSLNLILFSPPCSLYQIFLTLGILSLSIRGKNIPCF